MINLISQSHMTYLKQLKNLKKSYPVEAKVQRQLIDSIIEESSDKTKHGMTELGMKILIQTAIKDNKQLTQTNALAEVLSKLEEIIK